MAAVIIGLTGYARSGKDSVAEVLVAEFGYRRVGFADRLKEVALNIDPLIRVAGGTAPLSALVAAHGWEDVKTLHPESRIFLQKLGTSMRGVDPNIWITAAMRHLLPSARVVITDVRFPNEAMHIRQFPDGEVWRVTRPGVTPANGHASETNVDLIGPDRIIANDFGLAELRQAVRVQMGALV